MKIFISWSGETSHQVACVLRDWLPYVIQTLKPFISSGDIHKGERWSDVLAKELEETKFGIICLTPYNIKSPWLNFEAGALSKSIDHAFLSPFLFKVEPSEVKGPVSQFQSTIYEQEDVFGLLTSINNKLEPEIRLDIELLRSTFNVWWPQLQDNLDEIEPRQEVETETGYQWLHNPGEIANIELHIKCNKIWIITPSPYKDLQNTCVRDLVKKNLDRGVQYTVFLPLSGTTKEVEEILNQQIFSENSGQLTIKEFPYEQFQNLAPTHFLVLNPEKTADNPLRVFLELPIKDRDYWIEVDTESAYKFAARFRSMLEESRRSFLKT